MWWLWLSSVSRRSGSRCSRHYGILLSSGSNSMPPPATAAAAAVAGAAPFQSTRVVQSWHNYCCSPAAVVVCHCRSNGSGGTTSTCPSNPMMMMMMIMRTIMATAPTTTAATGPMTTRTTTHWGPWWWYHHRRGYRRQQPHQRVASSSTIIILATSSTRTRISSIRMPATAARSFGSASSEKALLLSQQQQHQQRTFLSVQRPFPKAQACHTPTAISPTTMTTSATNPGTTRTTTTRNTTIRNSENPQPQHRSVYTPQQTQVMNQCQELHSSIMELNERLRGPLAARSDRGTALPFVLLVGNHSSGKSSFINYVLSRNVQTAGVAPTDDCFTIIAPGATDRDQDGPAVTGDPDLGFGPLQQFGPTLIHHTVLKIRNNIDSNFIMVDSPGMIDAPANFSGMLSSVSSSHSTTNNVTTMDRGYDFAGVVRWFADRADVVLLFFDPDKPGTTGETLSILLHSLSGMDHKLLIVLNKADQFAKIHDFARAYGSLCWNLSKVIPRKDLPRIYTMCLPVAENKMAAVTVAGSSNNSTTAATPIPAALQDLHTARDEVVAQVRKAPARRLDNVITHLADAVGQLHMHAAMVQDVRTRWSRLYWQGKRTELATVGIGTALTASVMSLSSTYYGQVATDAMIVGSAASSSLPAQMAGGVMSATLLGLAALHWYHGIVLREWERQAVTPDELAAAFARTHARAIADGDEHAAALWQRIRDKLASSLRQESSIGNLDTVSKADLQRLQNILDVEIPKLRRQISPQHFGKNE